MWVGMNFLEANRIGEGRDHTGELGMDGGSRTSNG